MQNKIEKIVEKLYEIGVYKATIIKSDQVVTDVAFRKICESNGCGMYGKCWTCPPYCGDIEYLISTLDKYCNVLVFQSVGQIEDSYDFEGMTEHKRRFVTITSRAKEFFELEAIDALVLGAGGCGICDKCSKRDGLKCKFPQKALTSLEAYGINVSELAKAADTSMRSSPSAPWS